MFERFTARARQVVVLAQEEAQLLKRNYIGTEHILLGLLREEVGLSACVLDQLGVKIDDVRERAGRIAAGDEAATGPLPFTPRTKRVLESALREALLLGHNYIGTEHLLLGLIREHDGGAARILLENGMGPEKIRSAVMRTLAGSGRVALTDEEAAALKVEIIRTAAETLRDAAVILETAAQALTEIPA